ncbi:hypothetical protein C8F04DRAFT_1303553 [Mycena alexandri]|uniref:Uncharacterized protein n=1 Tax=Mycena alexandri TaxID=1745969 RepID=A0AAD6SEK0_9AGAR|nr:hypothetical protein C8F04DRAFT_1303553 [Mycena alexandri]
MQPLVGRAGRGRVCGAALLTRTRTQKKMRICLRPDTVCCAQSSWVQAKRRLSHSPPTARERAEALHAPARRWVLLGRKTRWGPWSQHAGPQPRSLRRTVYDPAPSFALRPHAPRVPRVPRAPDSRNRAGPLARKRLCQSWGMGARSPTHTLREGAHEEDIGRSRNNLRRPSTLPREEAEAEACARVRATHGRIVGGDRDEKWAWAWATTHAHSARCADHTVQTTGQQCELLAAVLQDAECTAAAAPIAIPSRIPIHEQEIGLEGRNTHLHRLPNMRERRQRTPLLAMLLHHALHVPWRRGVPVVLPLVPIVTIVLRLRVVVMTVLVPVTGGAVDGKHGPASDLPIWEARLSSGSRVPTIMCSDASQLGNASTHCS